MFLPESQNFSVSTLKLRQKVKVMETDSTSHSAKTSPLRFNVTILAWVGQLWKSPTVATACLTVLQTQHLQMFWFWFNSAVVSWASVWTANYLQSSLKLCDGMNKSGQRAEAYSNSVFPAQINRIALLAASPLQFSPQKNYNCDLQVFPCMVWSAGDVYLVKSLAIFTRFMSLLFVCFQKMSLSSFITFVYLCLLRPTITYYLTIFMFLLL